MLPEPAGPVTGGGAALRRCCASYQAIAVIGSQRGCASTTSSGCRISGTEAAAPVFRPTAGRSEPVTEAGCLLAGVLAQQGVERAYQPAHGVLSSAWIPGGTDEYQTVVASAALIGGVGEGDEVEDVLGDDRTMLLLGHREDPVVVERAQLSALRDGAHLVTASAELVGDRRRVHLVHEKPHPSASRARSQASRRRSASRRLASIRSS